VHQLVRVVGRHEDVGEAVTVGVADGRAAHVRKQVSNLLARVGPVARILGVRSGLDIILFCSSNVITKSPLLKIYLQFL